VQLLCHMSVLRRPIPDKLVVLTFDDGSISQLRVAGPLLRELGFGATFFITEGLKIPEDRMLPADERTFMTWEEVRELHTLGGGRFEIANHTQHHRGVPALSHEELTAELRAIDESAAGQGLPPTSTFCYPGYSNTLAAVETLRLYGMGFARRGTRAAIYVMRNDSLPSVL
jgi:peptidoglycan/xylan/chitin deacetylase (PgdA/CDA1 family)